MVMSFISDAGQLGPVSSYRGRVFQSDEPGFYVELHGTARHPGILEQPSERTVPEQVKNSRLKIPHIKK